VGIADKVEPLMWCCIELVAAVHLSLPELAIECEKMLGLVEEAGKCVAFKCRRVLASGEILVDGSHFVVCLVSTVAGREGSCFIARGNTECPDRCAG
jgi:hypothetical protein